MYVCMCIYIYIFICLCTVQKAGHRARIRGCQPRYMGVWFYRRQGDALELCCESDRDHD
jgi:hypothetical protein